LWAFAANSQSDQRPDDVDPVPAMGLMAPASTGMSA